MAQPTQPDSSQQPQVVYVQAPPEKKPFWKKKWFIVLAVIIVLIIAVQATGDGSKKSDPTADSGTSAGAESAANGDSKKPEPGSKDGSGDPQSTTTYNGIKKGDVAVNAGESITAKGVTITSTPLEAGDSTFKQTACTTVTIQNSSGKEIDFNLLELSMLLPSGTIDNSSLFGSDNMLSAGKLIDGGSTTGDVCFEADIAAGGQFVVIYEPLSFFSQHREAWVNNF
ncbi:hypothetical protein [Actinomyces sp. oral taxon 897]|uniref:hypothetical protein n=1 Tax=Actinomyces sp. oral taxon 897 TaxID=2081702 RepID=UPI000D03EB4B|nr:hypothetical protein [Actinomyces sp. oral taxon 897]AVM62554.1 hypothetical protein C3V41_11615 [Actinomyces sp. oral taxon 897]